MTELYPLALRLDGRHVLVVGGGPVATRRVPALLNAGAAVRLVSPGITPALRGLADAGRLEWAARAFAPDDLDGVWLVQVAIDDPVAAHEISRLCEGRRIFCVRADDRKAASAWTPAVTRHGPVTVAVLAGGDPKRAVAVRDLVSRVLTSPGREPALTGATGPPAAEVAETGAAAAAAGEAGVDAAGIGAASAIGAGVTEPGGVEAGGVEAGGVEAGGVEAGVAETGVGAAVPQPGGAGTVALVGAGPGDPELITVKGRRLLAAADVVVADRLVPGLLLDEMRPDVEFLDVAKLPYGPAAVQDEINKILVDRARAGKFVVRLKGGDPFVFGRGGEEVLACAAAGVPVRVVPGVTSAIAVPALAGIPVTHRGVAHEFTVLSGHLAPDDPASLVDWPALARMRGTLVILMGLRQLPAIVATLLRHGRDPQTPAAIVQEGTTKHQRVVPATLAGLPAACTGLRPPAIVIIGPVASILDTTR